MRRHVVATVAVTAMVAAATFVWLDARQERQYRRLIADGDTAAARGQTFEAIEAFSGALTLKPDSMIARLKRGDTYRRRGEFEAAVRDLGEAATLDPTAPRPLELLGDAHAAMGQPGAAILDYQSCLRLDDRAPRVAYKLGLAHYRNRNTAEAAAALRHAISLDDRVAEAHYLLGLSLGDREEAERAFLRALEIDPTLAAAREELAALYASSRRAQKAIDQLEALSALDPGRPEGLVRVGLAYARLGRRDAAILTLGRAAERHPGAAVVQTALGRVWLESAESQEDQAALGKALEALAPAAAQRTAASDTLALYGRALYLSGNAAAAERVLRRAVEQFPIDPSAFTYLAEAARRLGHVERAREASARRRALVRE